jgi:hypothetical protein
MAQKNADYLAPPHSRDNCLFLKTVTINTANRFRKTREVSEVSLESYVAPAAVGQ